MSNLRAGSENQFIGALVWLTPAGPPYERHPHSRRHHPVPVDWDLSGARRKTRNEFDVLRLCTRKRRCAVVASLKEWGLIILWGLYVLWPSPSLAAELTQMQAATIYLLAHSTSGYKLPETSPEIHLVPQKFLQDMVCPGKPCAVHALQVREKIYLDQELDMQDILNASILYHEMVHYLQFVNKGEAKNCEEWMAREYEAYGLQAHVLEKAGVRRLQMPALACS